VISDVTAVEAATRKNKGINMKLAAEVRKSGMVRAMNKGSLEADASAQIPSSGIDQSTALIRRASFFRAVLNTTDDYSVQYDAPFPLGVVNRSNCRLCDFAVDEGSFALGMLVRPYHYAE
jgi:hypothetical protein